MRFLRALLSLLRGTSDADAFADYRRRLLAWAAACHGLSAAEYERDFAGRYESADQRDLFLEYLLAASKESPSYLTEHEGMLADRGRLVARFGLPILTPNELRVQENARLKRLDSPLRV